MEKKQRLFIYDRKEMTVLIVLAVMVALFAFTLGIHLGKRVATPVAAIPAVTPETHPAATVEDAVAPRQEIADQASSAQEAADESMDRALHEEVAKSGIKLDVPRQIELPERVARDIPAALRTPPGGRFTLQVGSHPKLSEARDQISALEALGQKPYLRSVDLPKKGKWFRVYVGGYESRDEAEEAGAQFKAKKMVESFIVAPAKG